MKNSEEVWRLTEAMLNQSYSRIWVKEKNKTFFLYTELHVYNNNKSISSGHCETMIFYSVC